MGAILVTGGAGYVGSHTVKELLRAGRTPVIVDDLSEGHAAAVGDAELVVGDIGSRDVLDGVLAVHAAARG